MAKRFLLQTAFVLACCASSATAQADLVKLQWRDGQFIHKGSIAAKKFVEVCGPIKKFQSISWGFKSTGAVDFNIHYHVEKEVVTPVDQKSVETATGVTNIEIDQEYCWMWTNKTERAVTIEVTLTQVS
jgi:hypothetical protein